MVVRRCHIAFAAQGRHLSPDLHGFYSGRRAIGRSGRNTFALCDIHAALGRAKTKNPRRARLSLLPAGGFIGHGDLSHCLCSAANVRVVRGLWRTFAGGNPDRSGHLRLVDGKGLFRLAADNSRRDRSLVWSRTPPGRLSIDGLMLKIPLAGKLLVQLAVAQATRSLSTLLAGGITLVESWEIAAESITNLELRRRSSAILPLIREGRSFTESLEAANWMPELAIDMVGIGERSGSLREMLEEVAIFYDAEGEVRLEQLTTTLEPAILVLDGRDRSGNRWRSISPSSNRFPAGRCRRIEVAQVVTSYWLRMGVFNRCSVKHGTREKSVSIGQTPPWIQGQNSLASRKCLSSIGIKVKA